MKPVDAYPEIASTVRTLRIIVGMLVLGLGGFIAYTTYLVYGPNAHSGLEGDGMLTWVALGLAFVQTLVLLVIRSQTLAKARAKYRDDDIEGFCAAYQGSVITSAALVEGSGFFAAIAHMTSGGPIALGVACFAVFVLLLLRPSEGRMNSFLETAR
jgi:hypothetical protein